MPLMTHFFYSISLSCTYERKKMCEKNLKFELLGDKKVCQSIFDWKTIFNVNLTVSFKNRVLVLSFVATRIIEKFSDF